MSRTLQLVIASALLFASGCATIGERHTTRHVPDSLIETLAIIEEQGNSWRSLKAKAKCTLVSPDLSGPKAFKCNLAFKKEDNLRIVSNSLLGRDFDLLIAGPQLRLSIPGEDIHITDPSELQGSLLPVGDDPGLAVRMLFQSEPTITALRASKEVKRLNRHTWEVKAPLSRGSLTAIVRIDALECSVIRCIIMRSDSESPEFIAEYGGFKEISGITFPTHMVLLDTAKNTSLRVELKNAALDPELHRAMFDVSSVR
ncbi:hypothetical protein ACFL1X_04005 [Candidatus Hydrogenedentota bacterium]